jgi:Na+/H+-dicarboxylate symporter
VQLVAFSTASSFGTLPVTYKVVTEDLKVSKEYASFVLPLGSTINMDGCGGIYPAIAAIFIANLYGIPLDWLDYLLIAGTATVASLGTAGVPGTALVMLTVTLSVVGLPLEGIAFIAAVDRIVDMMRTTTNVTGDTAVALVVASQEQLLAVPETKPDLS